MGVAEWKMLLDGTITTVWISALSIFLGLILGLLIAFIRTFKLPVIEQFLSLFISIVRAAPLVTVVLFLFSSISLQLGASVTAVLALTINTSAFNAEIWRNALSTFPKGQREAGLASGMTESQVFRRIMLPQMFLTSLPALVNEMTFLVKASPAIAAIGVVDLTRVTYRIGATTYDPLPPILIGCVIYMVILGIMLRCQRWSERYVHRLSM